MSEKVVFSINGAGTIGYPQPTGWNEHVTKTNSKMN